MVRGIEQGGTEPLARPVGAKKRPMIAFHEKTEKRLQGYPRAAGGVGSLDLKALLARALPAGARARILAAEAKQGSADFRNLKSAASLQKAADL